MKQLRFTRAGEQYGDALLDPVSRVGPFFGVGQDWFMMDMDGDGLLNGPSDWDTDGDGMHDGFQYCYSTQRWRVTTTTKS